MSVKFDAKEVAAKIDPMIAGNRDMIVEAFEDVKETVWMALGSICLSIKDLFDTITTEDQFLDVVAEYADTKINAGLLEPFDGPAVGMVLKFLNKKVMHKWYKDDWLARLKSLVNEMHDVVDSGK